MIERRGREAYRAWSRVTLRWGDNDAYGHVNNTIYYAWFDSAVNAWLVDAGLLDIAAGDPIGLVAGTACDYFAPLSFPGEAEIGLAVDWIGTSSVTYLLGVFAPGAASPVAQGRFTHVMVGRDERRPVPVPDEWRMALERLA